MLARGESFPVLIKIVILPGFERSLPLRKVYNVYWFSMNGIPTNKLRCGVLGFNRQSFALRRESLILWRELQQEGMNSLP